MKIAFYGDSLTVGAPGASYFKLLHRDLPEHMLLNYGRINDTALSLYYRVCTRHLLEPVDVAFVFVGVNDLLMEHSWFFSRVRRHWACTDADFRLHYRALLDVISPIAGKVVAISPLFMGEDFDGVWQRRLEQRAAVVADVARELPGAGYADLRGLFAARLKNKPVCRGVRQNLLQSIWDGLFLQDAAAQIKASADRGFHYTIDSVHLNPAGAHLVAEALKTWIK